MQLFWCFDFDDLVVVYDGDFVGYCYLGQLVGYYEGGLFFDSFSCDMVKSCGIGVVGFCCCFIKDDDGWVCQ